jgi:hypothetical protein
VLKLKKNNAGAKELMLRIKIRNIQRISFWKKKNRTKWFHFGAVEEHCLLT